MNGKGAFIVLRGPLARRTRGLLREDQTVNEGQNIPVLEAATGKTSHRANDREGDGCFVRLDWLLWILVSVWGCVPVVWDWGSASYGVCMGLRGKRAHD